MFGLTVRRDIPSIFEEMDSLFRPFETGLSKGMETDVTETDSEYVFKINVPGYDKSEISLSYEDDTLTVKMEKKGEEETKGKVLKKERYYSKTIRSFYLPNIDSENIKANVKNGILEIAIAKIKEQRKIKTINIE